MQRDPLDEGWAAAVFRQASSALKSLRLTRLDDLLDLSVLK
jgi:hypothetical protein